MSACQLYGGGITGIDSETHNNSTCHRNLCHRKTRVKITLEVLRTKSHNEVKMCKYSIQTQLKWIFVCWHLNVILGSTISINLVEIQML